MQGSSHPQAINQSTSSATSNPSSASSVRIVASVAPAQSVCVCGCGWVGGCARVRVRVRACFFFVSCVCVCFGCFLCFGLSALFFRLLGFSTSWLRDFLTSRLLGFPVLGFLAYCPVIYRCSSSYMQNTYVRSEQYHARIHHVFVGV